MVFEANEKREIKCPTARDEQNQKRERKENEIYRLMKWELSYLTF